MSHRDALGSREALLNQAIEELFDEWTELLAGAAFSEEDAPPRERLTTTWQATLAKGADPMVVALFLIAVFDGLAVQFRMAPEDTPSGQELVDALAAVGGRA